MKTKIKYWMPTVIFALFSVFPINCTTDDDVVNEVNIPVVSTNEITEVTQTTANSGGSITSDGGATVTERGVCWSTNQSPTVVDNKTTDGNGAGSFTSAITGLTTNTTYYVRAYATNNKGTGYGSAMSFTTLEVNNNSGDENGNIVFNPNITYGSMTDINGNSYKTITIGTQTWMAENLKVIKYNDGTTIPNVTDNKAWWALTTGAYCNGLNDPSKVATYGRLYNWYAVNTGKLCPTGWHVPSDDEWATLENYLIANGYNYDGSTTDNKIAKAMASSSGWKSYWYTGTIGYKDYPEKQNSSGFTALPGGFRGFDGYFYYMGKDGYWWTSTELFSHGVYYWSLSYCYSYLQSNNYFKETGYSVRCVRD